MVECAAFETARFPVLLTVVDALMPLVGTKSEHEMWSSGAADGSYPLRNRLNQR